MPLSLAVAAGLWLLSRRRGRRDTAESTMPYPRQEAAQNTASWQGYGYGNGHWERPVEPENKPAVELPGARGVELEGVSMSPRELIGDTYHGDG